MVSIIGCPELCIDQVDGGIGTTDIDDLFLQNRNKQLINSAQINTLNCLLRLILQSLEFKIDEHIDVCM